MSGHDYQYTPLPDPMSNKEGLLGMQEPSVRPVERLRFSRSALWGIAVVSFITGSVLFFGTMIASAPVVNNWGLLKGTIYDNSTEPQAVVSFGAFGYCIFDVQ
ncbi:MAG: hypothetical protein Q9224_005119 [Gallowayella concinna]